MKVNLHKLLSMLLVVTMIFGMIPTISAEGTQPQSIAQQHTKYDALASHDNAAHICEHCIAEGKTQAEATVIWTPWGEGKSKLPVAGGHYYLTKDLTVTPAEITSGHVVLCLNGKTVTAKNNADRFYKLSGTGSLTIVDCTATGEGDTYKAGKLTGGGKRAIFAAGSGSLNIYDGIFENNTHADDSHGGVFYLRDTMKLNIYGGRFANNSSKSGKNGGVICLSASGNTTYIENAVFDTNTANSGGVLYANVAASVAVKDTTFTGNIGNDGAGVINTAGNLILDGVTIQNNQSKGNTAANGLGAVFMAGTDKILTVKGNTQVSGNTDGADAQRNVVLSGNKIALDSLATTANISVAGAKGDVLTDALTDADAVVANFAADDEALKVDVQDSKLVLAEKTVTPPAPTHDHLCEDCKDANVVWTAWDISTQTRLPAAAGHYYLSGTATEFKVTPTEITSGHVVLCLNGKTVSAKAGDRFYKLSGTGSLTIVDCTATGEGDAYKAGSLTGGGKRAIFADGTGSLNIYDGIFENNSITENGGALYLQGSVKLNIYGGRFENNCSTSGKGGAIYLHTANNTAKIENAVFSNNTAKNGGAIYVNGAAQVTVKNTTFTGNIGNSGAGAVFTKGNLTLENVTITNNQTKGSTTANGLGAVSLAGSIKVLSVKGSTQIVNNTDGATEQRNVCFTDASNKIAVTDLATTAKVSVSAASGTVLTNALTDAEAVKGCFAPDNAKMQIVIKDSKLVLYDETYDPNATGHAHNCKHCDGANVEWEPWGKGRSKLPTAAGHYYLTKDLEVTPAEITSGEVVLCLNGYTVTSKAGDRFYKLAGTGSLSIVDCTATGEGDAYKAGSLTGGGKRAVFMDGDAVLNIYDGIFIGNSHTGNAGAIYLQGKAKLNIYGGRFAENNCTENGGVIYLHTANNAAHIENAVFHKNTAKTGGAVCAEANASVTVKNCLFTQNEATDATGGALHLGRYSAPVVEDSTFTGNKSKTNGGAMYILNGNLTVTNAVIQGNTADGLGGGVYMGNSGSKLTVTGTTFKNNASTGNMGGAIQMNATGNEANITDCVFIGNKTASEGGAVYVNANSVMNITDTTFTGNETEKGGALHIRDNCTVTIADSKLTGNHATKNAGAIYAVSSTMTIKESVVEANTCGGSGVAMYLTGEKCKLDVTGSTFKDNKSSVYAGGAILVWATESEANITGSVFTGNQVRSNGAAIYMNVGGTLHVDNTTFTGNMAEQGSCIYADRTKVNLGKVTIDGNISVTDKKTQNRRGALNILGGELNIDGAIIKNNYGLEDGKKTTTTGCALTTAGSTEQIKDAGGKVTQKKHYPVVNFISGSFENNEGGSGVILLQGTTVFNMKGGEIKNNSGTYGGAVYVSKDATFNLYGGTLKGNYSKGHGGAIYAQRATVNLNGGTITGNTSKTNGGGVFVMGSKLNLRGTSITYNKSEAGSGGGGIATGRQEVDGVDIPTTINMYSGTIAYNTAKNGGGVAVLGLGNVITFNMYGGTVVNNEAASGYGGGVFVSKTNTFHMKGGTIAGNTIPKGSGGGVYFLEAFGELTGGSIHNNTAGKDAGAIYMNNSTVNVKNMKLYENKGVNGGAIRTTGVVAMDIENCEIYDCEATTNGGGVYIGVNAKVNLRDCKFYDCKAVESGGAIWNGNATTNTMENLVFENNYCEKSGGAIMSRSGNTVTKNLTFIGNRTEGDGAALYLYKPTLQGAAGFGGGSSNFKVGFVLDGGVFRDNEAGGQGAALMVHNSAKLTASNLAIENNTSGLEGAAVWAAGDTTLVDVTATGNTSKNDGYAVYFADSRYDGHSYIDGMLRIGGDFIVKDNNGGEVYFGEQTVVGVKDDNFGENTQFQVTLASGVLTNKLFGTYHYEGGDLVYTVTYGDRSMTDPELDAALEDTDAKEQNGDVLLYVGVGVFVLAIVAVVVVLILKKKKNASVAEAASE